jgi:ATP-binding cassette subfamily B protein
VQQALRSALSGRTSLVIAHRLSTIHDADQILVIDDGRIRERGRHDELFAADGLYADLYRTQFTRREPVDTRPRHGSLAGHGPPPRPRGGPGLPPPGAPWPGPPAPV